MKKFYKISISYEIFKQNIVLLWEKEIIICIIFISKINIFIKHYLENFKYL